MGKGSNGTSGSADSLAPTAQEKGQATNGVQRRARISTLPPILENLTCANCEYEQSGVEMGDLIKRCSRCQLAYNDWLARKRPKLGRPKKPTIPPIVNLHSAGDRRKKIAAKLQEKIRIELCEILREGQDDWASVNEAQPYSPSVGEAIQNKRRDMEALAFVLEGFRGTLMMASHRLDLYRSKKEREIAK